MKKTYPEKLIDIGISIDSPFTTAKAKHTLRCLVCEHTWESTPISKLQSYKKYKTNGCPVCATNRKKQSIEDNIDQMLEIVKRKGYSILESYGGAHARDVDSRTLVRRNKCGHEWHAILHQIAYDGVKCRICNNEAKSNRLYDVNQKRLVKWKESKSDWHVYKTEVSRLTERTYSQHSDIINPLSLPRGRAGVDNSYQLDHIASKRFCFEYNIPAHVCSHRDNLQIIPWRENIIKREHTTVLPSIITQWKQLSDTTSDFLNEIQRFATTHSLSNDVSDTTCVLDNKIAVSLLKFDQYSEQQTGNYKFNLNQLEAFRKKGIQEIQIYQDEWIESSSIVLSSLAHRLGVTRVPRIHARKTTIIEITDRKIKRDFLNANHIQGTDRSNICYGAFHGEDIIAIMTFSKPKIMNSGQYKPKDTWELSRFATNSQFRCPGIASKLISHFVTNASCEVSSIVSYANKRVSNGDLYNALGFTEVRHNNPSYYYVIDGKRKHRWSFRKSILTTTLDTFDPDRTEYENMLSTGVDRVWDCGTILYELTIDKKLLLNK